MFSLCTLKFFLIAFFDFFAYEKTVSEFTFIFYRAFFLVLSRQPQFSGRLTSFNTFKTGKKTSIHADVQWRTSDDLEYTRTLLIRPGLNVHLKKQFTVTGGYAFIFNCRVINNVSGYSPEHRIWEQLLYNH